MYSIMNTYMFVGAVLWHFSHLHVGMKSNLHDYDSHSETEL